MVTVRISGGNADIVDLFLGATSSYSFDYYHILEIIGRSLHHSEAVLITPRQMSEAIQNPVVGQ
jgi:hypothetical protein